VKSYQDMLRAVLEGGKWEKNRTGIQRLSIHGYMFEHNLHDGFPLLTTKKMSLKNIAVELEFFIKGLQDKKWLQARNCHIWDEWANPKIVKQRLSDETREDASEFLTKEFLNKEKLRIQHDETDLGPIYGVQWRKWRYQPNKGVSSYDYIDQLKNVIETIKKDPTNTQQVVSAWNPADIPEMALPPCHYAFQLLSDGDNLDLLWNQRSCDLFLGIPYNIASYALLLHLIAIETGLIPNKLVGFFADLHLYENQVSAAKIQLVREPRILPQIMIQEYNKPFDIFKWDYDDFKLYNYDPHPSIKVEVAV